MTVGFAAIFACFLPNSPRKIWGFNQQQLDWLKWNYESDQKQEDHSDEITAKQGFVMAVTDPKTWMMCALLYATYTAAAVNNFFPTVVAGLGFGQNASYGLTAPPFVLCVICMLINGFHSDKVSPAERSRVASVANFFSDTRTLPTHRMPTHNYSHRQHHRRQHSQHLSTLRCHDAHARLLLLVNHRPIIMDFGQFVPASRQKSGGNRPDQLHV